ncbi:PhoP regulatory network YrbL family protein [Akkermansiaceae bacterium]|nr:PhoP regulatory network YrbL family protein [Akkermansiaceae bacterium]
MPASPDSPLILLKDKELHIASGAYARCYRHPEDASLCIKLPTSDPKAAKRLRADLAYYQKLHKKNTDLTHLSDFIGPCLTNLGPGHVFECITNSDGSVSKTLGHYLTHEPERETEIIEALHVLAHYLEKNRIMISDLHERNILLQIEPNKPITAMVVDGIGDRVAIQILNVFGSLVDGKIARRWNRFIKKLQAKFPSLEIPPGKLHLAEKK